ncbi:MAG: (E)-4-hydroxy-3-methylbut-2-enyl-diphosphate synthase, partial [Bacteroidales bacterium]|nr:(E)-4-hydroxy-3-methylbut-2-enyl-diphosphate synthase [Bacteroidales bacterium]
MQISDVLIPDFYTQTPFSYQRRKTKEINIGGIYMGGNHPIRVQSMTNVSTLNTEACVEQIIRLHQAGSELIRVSTPSIADAKNLIKIKERLIKRYTPVPLIADIHFQPKVAEIAAQYVEKIRINPGNYIDKNKEKLTYTETEYQQIIEQIADNLYPLLQICKQNGTVIRIGTNHGSLSQRIVNRYGNTPLGMAMSAMEFVTICNDFGFNDLVLSMKASNTKVMIQSVRLLVAMLDEKKWNYPLHLGVTEAGNGEYGRVKSAVGIMPLLIDGIGDTIRVSLTELPENEIPFANILANIPFSKTTCDTFIKPNYNPYTYSKRKTYLAKKTPFIVSNYSQIEKEDVREEDVKSFYTLQINNKIDQLNTAKGFIFQVDENDNLLHWRKRICQLNDSCDMRPIVWKFI